MKIDINLNENALAATIVVSLIVGLFAAIILIAIFGAAW